MRGTDRLGYHCRSQSVWGCQMHCCLNSKKLPSSRKETRRSEGSPAAEPPASGLAETNFVRNSTYELNTKNEGWARLSKDTAAQALMKPRRIHFCSESPATQKATPN